MSCYCDYEDMPTLYNEEFRKAIKQHKCCECGQTINKFDNYQVITGIWDGEFSRYKSCEKCADLRQSLSDVICVSIGDLMYEYKEYLNEYGYVKYDEETDEYIYPENHFNLNS